MGDVPNIRTGCGFDVHRFSNSGPLLLAGIIVDDDRGLEGTSDADVVAHAVCDSLLGASAQGDIGMHFPSSDPRFVDADSMDLLGAVWKMIHERGWRVGNVDVTVVSESVRIAPQREAMRANLARVLGLGVDMVSVKATTTDGMGSIGADEGVAATAVVTLYG
jgi:2-C-methyl-D-erythritol 2,4-cyclodiphosphate synthase